MKEKSNDQKYNSNSKGESNVNSQNEKWIIDTDPGIDDAFAIFCAMTFLKENLISLSICNGNIGVEGCFINAKKICVLKDLHIPIHKGCAANLSGIDFEASHFHGKDGLLDLEDYKDLENNYKHIFDKGNIANPLIDKYSSLKIIELSHKFPKNLSILAIGPLTNIAVALMLDPTLPQRINKLVIMGGSYLSFGNIRSNTEFNFACDPISAKIVFNNFHLEHNDVILYPWETCVEYLLQKKHIELIEKFESNTKNFIEKIINKKWFLNKEKYGVFADFGSAVYICNKNSVKKSIKRFVDISIDSDVNNFGQVCLDNFNFNVNNNVNNTSFRRKKVEIITSLDEKIYYECFKKMAEK